MGAGCKVCAGGPCCKAAAVLAGDAHAVAQQLVDLAPRALEPHRFAAWRRIIAAEVRRDR